jgi:hypothetical protein
VFTCSSRASPRKNATSTQKDKYVSFLDSIPKC